jgi:HKD family nuclease
MSRLMTKNLKDVLTQQANEPNLTNVDVLCSYIQMSGVNELRGFFERLQSRQVPVRIIITLQLGISDLDAVKFLKEKYSNVHIKAFTSNKPTFHAKAWLFRNGANGIAAIIGSSNMSKSAMVDGIEWNLYCQADEHVQNNTICHDFATIFASYWDERDGRFKGALTQYDVATHADIVSLQLKSSFHMAPGDDSIADDCEVAKAAAGVRLLKEEIEKLETDLQVAVLDLSKAEANARARAKSRPDSHLPITTHESKTYEQEPETRLQKPVAIETSAVMLTSNESGDPSEKLGRTTAISSPDLETFTHSDPADVSQVETLTSESSGERTSSNKRRADSSLALVPASPKRRRGSRIGKHEATGNLINAVSDCDINEVWHWLGALEDGYDDYEPFGDNPTVNDALIHAVRLVGHPHSQKAEIVAALIVGGGADVACVPQYPRFKSLELPLLTADKEQNYEVVDLLLKGSRTNIDFTSNAYRRLRPDALTSETKQESTRKLVKLLIEKGVADYDVTDQYGRTSLMIAVFLGHYEIVKMILNTGKGNVHAVNQWGRTAMSTAIYCRRKAICELFRARGLLADN